MEEKEFQERLEREVWEEIYGSDPVRRVVTLHHFVSRSKGLRNGKQRHRRRWKEVQLVKVVGGAFHQWDRFPFDIYASEILGEWADGEALKERVEELW